MQQPDNGEDLADLCRRCAEGDETAFSEVYRRFGGTLYGTALRVLKRPEEAEEVVQETFLTLYRKVASAQPTNLGGWLHRVAVNRSLDRLRSLKRRSEVELFEEGTGEPAFGLDIGRAVEQLPERARMVFVLHDVEGFKHREIAELMGIADGSSKSQLFRARALLREWLEREGTGR